jgi:putative transposase
MVDVDHPRLSIARQCELLSIARSSFYRTPCGESEMNLTLMRLIDEQFMSVPGMARARWRVISAGTAGV